MLYDLIIIGGGPAGSTLGRLMARDGYAVLLLDKENFPRPKTCAGGLTARVTGLLDLPLDDVIEDVACTLNFTYLGQRPLQVSLAKPLVLMTERSKLDNYLLERAKAAGVTVRCGQTVTNIAPTEAGVTVTAGSETYQGKILAGADGAHSFTAQALGLNPGYPQAIALACELRTSGQTSFQGSLHLDYGVIPAGYGWVFPKKDHLNVGLYSITVPQKNLKERLTSYLAWKFPQGVEILSTKGFPIPLGGKPVKLTKERCLLLGDAARLADPFTGEGIYYALESAYLAAAALNDYFKNHQPLLKYEKLVRTRIGAELAKALFIARVFYFAPAFNYRYFLVKEEILANYAALLAGQLTYQQLFMDMTKKAGKYLLPPFLYARI